MMWLSTRQPLVTAYVLGMGCCLFLWPVVVGFDSLETRFFWIVATLCLLFVSSGVLHFSLKRQPQFLSLQKNFPWYALLAFCILFAMLLVHIPLTSFSDEASIVLPSFTLLHRLARIISWPGVVLFSVCGIALFLWGSYRLRLYQTAIFIVSMAVFAGVVSWIVPQASTLAVRYPPIVHLLQSVGTVLTAGHLDAVRTPNILWTILLALCIWHLAASWNTWSKVMAFLALFLTPLGWIYHILIYQVVGELVLGMCVILLLSRTLNKETEESFAPLLGILFALWILLRPTSIALFVVCIALLVLWNKKQGALLVAGIGLPIAVSGLIVYFLGISHYPFLFQDDAVLPTQSLFKPLLETAQAIPAQMHVVGIIILLVGSILVAARCNREFKIALFIAWSFALVNIAVHTLMAPDVWNGYGRFNVFLLLPLAIVLAGIASDEFASGRWKKMFSIVTLFALLLITPYDMVRYIQRERFLSPTEMTHSLTAGHAAFAMPRLVRNALKDDHDIIILQPSSTYLDLFIATGLITVAERSQLIEESKKWTPASSVRPVFIQAPGTGTTYQPHVPAAWEQKLIEAALWARAQPNVEEVFLGMESTLIVR